jgi:hypothetical protein
MFENLLAVRHHQGKYGIVHSYHSIFFKRYNTVMQYSLLLRFILFDF